MRKKEIQFLTINTPSLWEEKRYSKENLDIIEEGLSLHKEDVHALGKKFGVSLLNPMDFAVDSCGVLYILDAANQLILQFDKGGRFLYTFKEDVKNPTYLTVENGFLYLLDDKQVLKFNVQTKAQELHIPLDMGTWR